jgi:hypothetical protein
VLHHKSSVSALSKACGRHKWESVMSIQFDHFCVSFVVSWLILVRHVFDFTPNLVMVVSSHVWYWSSS